ncbi:MAG: hypothetical protein DI592_22660 [Stenotrophomonas maltophilia]|nr:MAG: hypothetical protein DI592_22660 [Stenotrophomonas maltophilia]
MIDHQAETLRPLIGKNVKLRMEDGMATIGTDDSTLSLVLQDCRFDRQTMVAQFSSGASLTVDLSDDGYSGPEAMQLNSPDGTIVIWN